MEYNQVIAKINAIIQTYKNGHYMIEDVLQQVQNAINIYKSCHPLLSVDDIITKTNRLYKYAFNKLSKAINYIEKIS